MDEILNDVLNSIDLARTIVMIAEVHGESIYDDGLLSHDSRSVVIRSETPLVILGKKVPSKERFSLSCHVDLIPKLCEHSAAANRCVVRLCTVNQSSGVLKVAWRRPDCSSMNIPNCGV